MRDEYWRGIEEGGETAAVEARDYVVFHLAGERFALASTAAREVLRLRITSYNVCYTKLLRVAQKVRILLFYKIDEFLYR